jgi:hypothetical protein
MNLRNKGGDILPKKEGNKSNSEIFSKVVLGWMGIYGLAGEKVIRFLSRPEE